MVGLLAAPGIHVSSRRVGESLARVSPEHHRRRATETERQTNPIPSSAKYFGHKVHIDQNEKLVLFGLTHVCAVDGYSGMIVGFATIPVKNNSLIYEHLYRWVSIHVHGIYCIQSLTIFAEKWCCNMGSGTRYEQTKERNGT